MLVSPAMSELAVSQRRASPETLVRAFLLAWWCIYIYFAILPNGVSWEEAANTTESGSVSQRLLLFGMTLAMAPFAPEAYRKFRQHFSIELLVLGLYMIWAGLSVIWSDVPALTLRRYAALVLLCFSCVVLGAGFYGRGVRGAESFLRNVAFGSVLAALVSLGSTADELTMSNLLMPEWRSSLTQRGPELIFICSYGLSALAGLGLFRLPNLLAAALLLAGPLLFKARSVSFYAVLGAVAVMWRAHHRLLTRVFGTVMMLAPLGALILVNVSDSLPGLHLGDLVSRNEDPDLMLSFTGRVPLWNCILPMSLERPILGYGFGAFWSPERLENLWNCAGWTAVFAHNGFLDEALGTGLVGLTLMTAFWILALRRCLLLIRAGGTLLRPAIVAAVWIVLLFLCNSLDTIFQFNFKAPFYLSLILYSALMGSHAAEREAAARN